MSIPDFGSYVKELRRSLGLGLREAALKMGIAPSYLSRIENNAVPPPGIEILRGMATQYKIPISDLTAHLSSERTDVSSMDPVAAALYRIAMSAPASDSIKILARAVEDLNLPPEKKEWWKAELNRLQEQIRLVGGEGLLREDNGANDLYEQFVIPRKLRAAVIEEMAIEKLRAFCRGDLKNYVPATPIENIIEAVEPLIDLFAFDRKIGGSFPDGSPRVLGRCKWKFNGRLEIGIDERLFDAPKGSAARRRGNFTIAHEYFHAIEHLPRMLHIAGVALNRDPQPQFSESGQSKRKHKKLLTNEDWREYQANTFSAAILMPADFVREGFRARFGDDCCVVTKDELWESCLELAQWSNPDSSLTTISLADLFDVNPQAMAIRLETLGLVAAKG